METRKTKAKNLLVYFNQFGKMKVGTQSTASGFKGVNKVRTRTPCYTLFSCLSLTLFYSLFNFHLLHVVLDCVDYVRLWTLNIKLNHKLPAVRELCWNLLSHLLIENWYQDSSHFNRLFCSTAIFWSMGSTFVSFSFSTMDNFCLLSTFEFGWHTAHCWYTMTCEWDRWHYNL